MDILSDILSRHQVKGTLYFRTSFTSPWSVQVPAFENVARFHFAHKGSCFVRVVKTADPVLLEQGDLVIIPRGATHTLFCDPATEGESVHLDKIVEESGFTGHGALVVGDLGSNQETQLVCGHFAFDEHASHPVLESLPDYIHIKNYGEVAGRWMESTLRLIGTEVGRDGIGGDFIAIRMSEIILAQALRTFFATDGADKPVFAAFQDSNIAPVLTAIHKDPSKPLTLEALSDIACLSRTSFVARFSACMSMTPLKYVTFWRMQIARQLLVQTDNPILDIAESVGYQSEAAFGRVFKKHHHVAPATYRRQAVSA
ncbi:MAG: AraC family transcriptional regulator [Gammaproteobacteria bacterium]|nr:AraC family transcriptional regulator [Gammaproteobacteria bacterium]